MSVVSSVVSSEGSLSRCFYIASVPFFMKFYATVISVLPQTVSKLLVDVSPTTFITDMGQPLAFCFYPPRYGVTVLCNHTIDPTLLWLKIQKISLILAENVLFTLSQQLKQYSGKLSCLFA